MGYPLGNVPLDCDQNVLLDLLVRHPQGTRSFRRNVKKEQIEQLAVEVFNSSKKSITFKDLVETYKISKKRAQRRLKDCCDNESFPSEGRILFAPEKHKPQRYYPKCLKAEVTQYLAAKENVLIRPTGVTSSKHPLSNALEAQKAQNFLDILVRLPFAPLEFHKLQIQTSIIKENYNTLEHEPRPGNKAKIYEEYIANTLTTYTYSPNGTVEIAIACSQRPFRLETDDDLCIIFSFLGQVRDRMLYHLSDPRERIVPTITDWRLIQCDVNKDIEIDEKMQLTLPSIQLKYAGRVFRVYVKLLGESAVCRGEESLNVDLTLTDALDHIRNPNKELEKKNKELEKKIDFMIKLLSTLLVKDE